MKLIYCPKCGDMVKLRQYHRTCDCGLAWGKYLDDDLNAVIGGEAIPVVITNDSFRDALEHQPKSGPGYPFDSFVVSANCDTIKFIKSISN